MNTTKLREIGTSTGIIIPAKALKQIGCKKGDLMNIEVTDTNIILSRTNQKPTLDELIDTCDLTAPIIEDLDIWGFVGSDISQLKDTPIGESVVSNAASQIKLKQGNKA